MRLCRLSAGAALIVAVWCATAPAGDDLAAWVEHHVDEIVGIYKELHRHPELSFHEEQTARRLAEWSRAEADSVTEGVGGHGVVAVMENGQGPTVMLRADMDGLPVVERTGLDYASQVRTKDRRGATVGVMHACGHDIHMANLVGVARWLNAHRGRWQGTVLLVFQPAEERGAGAQAMLSDGLFQRFPRPDYALALHVDPTLEAGRVACRPGFILANVDSVDITIHGRGGHGAHPYATIDPIVIAARLVLDLQTIVSREVKPIEPAVVTVGSIRAGTKHNIIPDSCHLQLTIRSYAESVRRHLHKSIQRKAEAAAASAGAPPPDVRVSEGTPSLWNDPDLVDRLAGVFRDVLGDENVQRGEPSMGGEDFSRYGKAGVPIMMFRLGAISRQRLDDYHRQGQTVPSLHSALFYPDPQATLATGMTAMISAAKHLLATPNDGPEP